VSGQEESWEQAPSLLDAIWRHRLLIAVVTGLAVVAGYWLSSTQEPTYEATTRLFLSDPRSQNVYRDVLRPAVDPSRYVPQQAARVTSGPTLQRASELLDGEVSPEALAQIVSVDTSIDLDLLLVSARARNPDDAAVLANTVAEAYQDVAREATLADAEAAISELQSARDDLQQQISETEDELAGAQDDLVLASRLEALSQQLLDLDARAQQFAVDAAVFGSGIDLVEPAEAPDWPASPSPLRDAALAGIVGAALAGAAAYRLSGRRRVVEAPTEPAEVLGVPLLAEIPEYTVPRSRRQIARLPNHAIEAYQFLFASVEFALAAHGGSSVLVTSIGQGDGKTTTALQLGLAAVGDRRRVVLVDGDVRVRGLSQVLGRADTPGLTEVALDGLRSRDAVVQQRIDAATTLPVLPAGQGARDATSLFRTDGYRQAMAELKEHTELLFIDSSPILAVADATVA
jgi:Mrp family chromosome partitioning ATPase/capsular polysaccharide biosynthesis protein